jgi:hypothetical protein
MFCRLRAQRTYVFVALIVLSAFLGSAVFAGDIFKCVAKDGGPLYQNFPCYLDSIGSLASNPSIAKTPSMPGGAGQEKPNTQPVNVASTVKSAYTGELRVGMTEDEVRALLGEPEEMVDDEPAEGGRVSIWRYADGRIVQFDHKHNVLAVQR